MKSRAISSWIDQFLQHHPARGNSIIITIYGDFIAPHGGTTWLGSVIRLLEPLGVNERLVRTSVYRLSQEKWLVSQQIGRRSFYSLTPTGRKRFEHAYRRIYQTPANNWNGQWQIVVFPASFAGAARESVRRELTWAGYGAIAPGVMAHPTTDTDALLDLLQDAGVHDKVVCLSAASIGTLSSKPMQELAHDCWSLAPVAERYQQFMDTFRPLLRALRSTSELDPEQCFLAQTLLMHEFRRVLLHDPLLPSQLLPTDWSGGIARDLCGEIYRLTYPAAQRHLLARCETPDGQMPPAAAYFYERFGGL
jgi:phenylacetic acid degradation operon negative regulatory protein